MHFFFFLIGGQNNVKVVASGNRGISNSKKVIEYDEHQFSRQIDSFKNELKFSEICL